MSWYGFVMSEIGPKLGELNVKTIVQQIEALSPDNYVNRSIDFVTGYIMARTQSKMIVSRMWGAAQIIEQVAPELPTPGGVPDNGMTRPEVDEITYTLRMLANTLEGAEWPRG